MGARGRKTAASAELGVAEETYEKMPPPAHLSKSQKELWVGIVATKPAEWFKADSAPLLEAYCKEIEFYQELTGNKYALPKTLAGLEKLQAMRAKHVTVLVSLATRLRLTPQSRYVAQRAGRMDRDEPRTNPWDEAPDGE